MKPFLLLLGALALSGCVSLLPEQPPAPRLYVLEAGDVAAAPGAVLPVVLAVAAPHGEGAVLGRELAWRAEDRVAFIAQSQWTGRASDLLQMMLVETLSRQARVRAAVRSGEARADYEIRWDVLDFEVVEAGGRAEARFTADVKLMSGRTREVLGARIISAEAPVSGRSSSAAAQALARAAREGGARIAAFALETVEAQPSAASINR